MSARSRKRLCLQNGAPPGGRRWLWLVAGASGVLAAQAANADPQVVLPNGLPVQVKPTYSEPGLPAFSFPTGGGSLLGGSHRKRRHRQRRRRREHERRRREHRRQRRRLQHDDVAELGFGCGQCGGSDGRERDGARSDVCDGVRIVRTWGRQEAAAASGAFQMINSTYTADINGAVAYDPAISGTIVSGLAGQMDPRRRLMRRRMSCAQTRLSLQNNTYKRSNRPAMCGLSISLAPTPVPVSPAAPIPPISPNSLG